MNTTSDIIEQDTSSGRDIYTVSRLNQEVRHLLEGEFGLLWVEGEISNFVKPASGHMYLSLKDRNAQVRCAMFKGRNALLRFAPENGMQVTVRARVSLYEPRGDYQLIIEHMEESGDGALRRAYEELKQKLYKEGLFDEKHKKAIPALPNRIGVITSPTGAAIRDILSVLKRRFPSIPVVIYPVAVQGDNAGSEIAAMVETANKRNECDVLIVTRGGGSLEDLWAFNDEILARSIFNSDIPVIAGVGHEIDFTIADFVADRRAPTPSVAAEIASPDAEELAQHVQHLATRHLSAILSRLQGYSLRLDGLLRRLRHPGQRLQMTAQRLDELEQRANQALHHRVRHTQSAINELATRLKQHTPAHTVEKFSLMGKTLEKRLLAAIHSLLRNKTQQFVSLSQALDIVSPLATLDRGYAIVMDEPGQHVLRDSSKVKKGDRLKTRLAKGQLISRVEEISD